MVVKYRCRICNYSANRKKLRKHIQDKHNIKGEKRQGKDYKSPITEQLKRCKK